MNESESNQENAQNAQNPDTQRHCEHEELDIGICRLAVESCLLGITSFSLYIWFWLHPMFLHLGIIAAILSFIFGVAAIVSIERSCGRLTGKGYAAIGIAIPLATFFLAVLYTWLNRSDEGYLRIHCGVNLSGISKAMLVYANDYDDEFPRAGGPNSVWGPTSNFQAATPAEAYGLNDGGARASISANFYLLVKYAEVTPKSFLCPGDKKTSEFDPAEYDVRNKELTNLWDFGRDPSKHCGYSYHIPYGSHGLSASDDPGLALAADRNPWLPSRGAKPRKFESFDPDGNRDAIRAGNTPFHERDGQNVAYVDGHTMFEKTSACGLNSDNVYTSQNGDDVEKGILPTMTSQPANNADSLLVHDPPTEADERKTWALILPVSLATVAAITVIFVLLRSRPKEQPK